MKTMKKLWISICSVAFAFALGLGVKLGLNSKPLEADASASLGSYNVSLNMAMSDLGHNGVMSEYNSKYLYLAIENGTKIPYGGDGSNEDWSVAYTSVGDAVKVNGVAKETKLVKTHQGARAALALYEGGIDVGANNVGDTLTIDGSFTHAEHGTFTLKEATFIYDGYTWMEDDTVTYKFEHSNRTDVTPAIGFYASMEMNDIPVGADSDGWEYWTDPCASNQYILTSGGVSTVFQGNLCKFGASDWYIGFANGATGVYDSGNGTPQNGDVITLGGWFGCMSGSLGYIKIANAQYEYQDGVWTNITPSITVKLSETNIEGDVISVAPGSAADVITASCDSGNVDTMYEFNAIEDGKFVLRAGENVSNYRAMFTYAQTLGSRTVYFTREMIIRVGFEDFVMEEGASVRTVGDNVNGLRFTAEMTQATYENLTAQGAKFGMVIVPRDYITSGYELTAENLFGANAKYSATAAAGKNTVRRMLLLENLNPTDADGDGKYEIRGAITDILTNNLTREFVAVAYANVGGRYVLTSFYGDDMENNARSIYYVAQKAIDAGDNESALQTKYIDAYSAYVASEGKTYNRTYTVNYIKTVNGKSTVETETFTAALNSEIHLTAKEFSGFKLSSASTINSKIYANKENVFNFYYMVEGAAVYDSVAWYHPQLDSSNNYDNATNNAIAKAMKDAGFTTVILAGAYNIVLDSEANIAITRLVIDMFYRNGIKSIVCAPNWTDNENYGFENLPDFSNHEGFAGFHVWDEPYPREADLETLAQYADWYMAEYDDVEGIEPFMVNLNPSYAPFFNGDTSINPEYTSYADYIQAYCDIVLSKFDGTNYPKFLSVDTYPIKNDGTLRENFLYDMAVLKYFAMENEAHTHIALQVCGWDDTPDDGNRADYDTAPSEEEMRLQLYTALAFGADSVSWWGYAPIDVIVDAPLDSYGNKTEVYDSIQAVNGELATFGSLYKNYNWQGVIMSSPSSGFFGLGADAQYKAYKKVQDESVFSKYLLSASNTSSFSSISGSGSNHIVSVMKDADGNEAFVAVNYSAVKDNKTLTLTLKGEMDGAQFAIYKNGEMETVTIGTSGYTLTLAPGEGAFIVEANSEHTVTFKNWDGTVLQEETLTFGSIPEYKGETPTKARYNFTGWTPAIGAINSDTVYTALFETSVFETYESGAQIEKYPTAIPVTDLEGKALSFDFKIDGDGSFGGAICASNWANVTGTLKIAKNGDVVTASFGRITEYGDGWYNWTLNQAWFAGDGASNATDVGLFYHQNVALTGTVHIDWTSWKAVDAYAHDRELDAYPYLDGTETINHILPVRLAMTELAGKAVQIPFKMEGDGQFGFALNSLTWANLTGEVVITKTDGVVTANQGEVLPLGDNWYAWRLNRTAFAGDGVNRGDATEVGLAYWGGTVSSDVYVDWADIQVVDAYRGTYYANGTKLTGADGMNIPTAISMTALEGKALHLEFTFESETGSFGMVLCDRNKDWANLVGSLVITKSAGNVTANIGRIIDAGDGWYAWELNRSDFAGDGAGRAENFNMVYHQNQTVTGTVRIDWSSFQAVDAFETRGTVYTGGNVGTLSLPNPIAMTDLEGKAIHFEFKFETDGQFGFAILASSWANAMGTVRVTKSGDSVTAQNWCNATTASNFRVVSLEDGWYAFEMNHSDFVGDGLANATDIGLIYYQNEEVVGTVRIDWTSFAVVEATIDRSKATSYTGSATIDKWFTNTISMNDLVGKAYSFDFKFDADGSFGLSLQSGSWCNLTGTVTITKSGESVTATQGIVVARTDGWYSWQLNYDLFHGDGFNRKSATEVAFIYWSGTVSGTAYIDWASAKVVEAYDYDRTAFATKYEDGALVSGGGGFQLGASMIAKEHWDNQWAGFKIHFEFKFETDGSFGFAILASDWKNVMGTIRITKSGDSRTVTVNGEVLNTVSIIDLGDGWYAFEMNAEDFVGDGKDAATDINLIYHQDVVISGTVWINWHFKALPTA